MDALIAGLVSALSALFLLAKLDMRKCLGYDVPIDITFTVGVAWLMKDTYSGISSAMIGGLLLSVLLIVLKKFLGAERIDWKLSFRNKRLTWIEVHKGKFAGRRTRG